MSRELGRALMHQSRKHMTPIFHVGQVQSIQPGPPPQLTVIFSGGTTAISNISYLSSYSPQVGDFCHAIHTGKPDVPGGADWLVIGAVAQLPGTTVGTTVTGSVAIGSAPPVGTRLIAQEGTTVFDVTNGAGGCGFSWPQAFPNGIVSFLVVPGDDASGLAYFKSILGNCSLSGWNGIAYQAGGAVVANGSPVQANFRVLGW